MTFDPNECWDCPVQFWVALAFLVLGIGSVAAGLAAGASQRFVVRAAGNIAVALGTVWYLAVAVYVPRWGVDWSAQANPWNPLILPTRQRLLFLASHAVMLGVIVYSTLRRRHVHA